MPHNLLCVVCFACFPLKNNRGKGFTEVLVTALFINVTIERFSKQSFDPDKNKFTSAKLCKKKISRMEVTKYGIFWKS